MACVIITPIGGPLPLTPAPLCCQSVERLGELLKSGELKDIVAIPTSIRTKEQAESLDIPLVTLDTHSGTLFRLIRIQYYILLCILYVLFSTCQVSTPQLSCEVCTICSSLTACGRHLTVVGRNAIVF